MSFLEESMKNQGKKYFEKKLFKSLWIKLE